IPEDAQFEDQLHLRAVFAECGIGIAWFSCAREFFNAMMGILVGHFNGYIQRKVLQSDISNMNIWLQIPKPELEYVVPDWPEDKGPDWYLRQTGLLGDWGYGMDCSDGMSRQRDNSCSANHGMEAGLPWAGEFMGHSILHDLEALVWFMWVFCINMDGPF
ncbi:hypothetical protein SCLCIDRAFT_91712, partial [Scleroderma citrinum Foug A]